MKSRLINVLAYGTALAITRVIIIVLSPLLVMWVNEVELARWSVSISLSSMFAAVLGMGLSTAAVRWYYDALPEGRAQMLGMFLSLRLISFVGIGLFVAVVSALAWKPLTGGTLPILPYLPMLIVFGIGESIARFLASVLRLHNQPLKLLLLRLMHALGAGGVVSLTTVVSDIEPFVSFSIAYLLLALPMFFVMVRYVDRPETFFPAEVVPILRFSLPLTLHDLGWWFRGMSLTLVVANFEEGATLSAFFLSMLVLMPFGVLFAGIDQTLAADYYRDRSQGKTPTNARKNYRIAIFASSIIASGCMLLTAPVAHAFFVAQADIIITVCPIVLFGAVFHGAYVVWVKPLIYLKKSGLLLFGTATISITGVSLAAFLGPSYGYIAVAWLSAGMFAGTALFALLAVYFLKDEPLDLFGPISSLSLSGLTLAFVLL